ncbi:MAG: hypothetical protein LBT88_06115 [Oscillospiraceae bacterium]|nr:hypothetical protein [Oscillospiraceae bacterium]
MTVGTVYPQYGNRKFLGWFTSPSAVNPFDFSTPVESSLVNSGSSAIVLYGRWSAPVALTAAKSAVGSPLPNNEFEFGVFDSNGNLVSVGTADSSGNIAFPDLQIDAAGTYNYTIREISIDGAGWTVDRSSYPVVVTAAANGQGQLTASAAYPNGVPGFVNTYSGTPTSESVYVYKELLGWNHPELQFEFGLYDDSGNLLETAQNSNGVAQFPLITYTSPGVYNYTVREISTSGNGWTTDSSNYPIEVTVTDDGMGNLVTDIDYPQGQPVFVNRYSPNPAKAALTAQTQLCGGCLQAQMFSFGLFSPDGKLVEKAANDSCGCVVFPTLTFEEAGIYTYTILELPLYCRDLSASPCSYKAVVTVTDDGKGQLHATVSYEGGCPPLFVNCYRLSPQTLLFF